MLYIYLNVNIFQFQVYLMLSYFLTLSNGVITIVNHIVISLINKFVKFQNAVSFYVYVKRTPLPPVISMRLS